MHMKKKGLYFVKKYPILTLVPIVFSLIGGLVLYYLFKRKYSITKNKEDMESGRFFGRLGFYMLIVNLVLYLLSYV